MLELKDRQNNMLQIRGAFPWTYSFLYPLKVEENTEECVVFKNTSWE